jgi:hypothetical protein
VGGKGAGTATCGLRPNFRSCGAPDHPGNGSMSGMGEPCRQEEFCITPLPGRGLRANPAYPLPTSADIVRLYVQSEYWKRVPRGTEKPGEETDESANLGRAPYQIALHSESVRGYLNIDDLTRTIVHEGAHHWFQYSHPEEQDPTSRRYRAKDPVYAAEDACFGYDRSLGPEQQ